VFRLRLRRLYLSMDIAQLLLDRNLEPEKLMPSHRPDGETVILNALNQDPAPFPPFLALNLFDNEDYEIWTPSEWLNKGISNGVYKPVPAKALLPDIDSDSFRKHF
jgi:hypothetical protein